MSELGERITDTSVLIVDDDNQLRTLLCERLTKKGYLAFGVENGKKAMQLLWERHTKFGRKNLKAIVSDWVMPVETGIQLLTRLRTSPFKHIPFVLISGEMSAAQLEDAKKHDADAVIAKPFELDTLCEMISEAVRIRASKG